MTMKKKKELKKVYCKESSTLWKLTKGEVMTVSGTNFYNGETHYTGTINGKVVTYPTVIFSDTPVDKD